MKNAQILVTYTAKAWLLTHAKGLSWVNKQASHHSAAETQANGATNILNMACCVTGKKRKNSDVSHQQSNAWLIIDSTHESPLSHKGARVQSCRVCRH